MASFGGTVRFTYAGTPLTMRGHITIMPASVKATGIPNQDGSTSVSFAPTGRRANMKFEDSTNKTAKPPDWDGLIKGGPYANVTVVEDLTNVTHVWTQAKFVGEPKTDRETGETDGVEIIADDYTTLSV